MQEREIANLLPGRWSARASVLRENMQSSHITRSRLLPKTFARALVEIVSLASVALRFFGNPARRKVRLKNQQVKNY